MKALHRSAKSCTRFSFLYRNVSFIATAQFEVPILEEDDYWACTKSTFFLNQQALVKSCANRGLIDQGMSCHAQIIHCGLQTEIFTANMLINLYSKCGNVGYARKVFDGMCLRSVVSWNTIIAAYTRNGNGEVALELFVNMLREGFEFSEFALSSVLRACATKILALESKQLHACAVKTSMESDEFVRTALVDVYAKCRAIRDAFRIFESMPGESAVTWSSMIAGFVKSELYEEALVLFKGALRFGVKICMFTSSPVLSACAGLAALIEGKQVHGVMHKTGLCGNVYIASSLIDVYAKCGSIRDSYAVFVHAEEKNVVMWNTMISGFAKHARSLEAMVLFEKMQQIHLYPNEVTYLSVLSACAHTGLVEKGRKYFDMMKTEHNLSPKVFHYSCMVDIHCKIGQLDEAKDLMEKMPFEAIASMWGSLLASCKVYRNVELGEIAAKKLFILEPHNAGNRVLLSNIYSASRRWADVAASSKLLNNNEVKKKGFSWIEIKDKVHFFMGGKRFHPRILEIYSRLDELLEDMRKMGYKCHSEHDLHDVEDSYKNELLEHHTEKLAFTFGLMCLPAHAPIRIMKNLRTCGDCHAFMKVASGVTGREIIVRDNSRFHHFKDGICSCGDFW